MRRGCFPTRGVSSKRQVVLELHVPRLAGLDLSPRCGERSIVLLGQCGRRARRLRLSVAHRRRGLCGCLCFQFVREDFECGSSVTPGCLEALGRLRLQRRGLGRMGGFRLQTHPLDSNNEVLFELCAARFRRFKLGSARRLGLRPIPPPAGQADELAETETGMWRRRRISSDEREPRLVAGVGDARFIQRLEPCGASSARQELSGRIGIGRRGLRLDRSTHDGIIGRCRCGQHRHG